MTLAQFRQHIDAIPYGKRLPTALYVYRGDGATFGEALDSLLACLAAAFGAEPRAGFQSGFASDLEKAGGEARQEEGTYPKRSATDEQRSLSASQPKDDAKCTLESRPKHNVLKFRLDELKISFLAYPDFLTDPHPALRHAITVDLATGKHRVTDYARNANPPILHRKESFLPPNHPKHAEFAALTRAEEGFGLYQNTTTIGFKLNWEQLLVEKGLTIEGHTIHASTVSSEPRACFQSGFASDFGMTRPGIIDRHKTALTRYELSKPVKSLLEYGMLKAGITFFDYGCGQGSDVRGLQSLGHSAEGWDPVHRPDVSRREADIVNMGYVLNVIEDPAERLETLVDAHRHAKRPLVVSGLITETVETSRAAQYRDRVVSRCLPLATVRHYWRCSGLRESRYRRVPSISETISCRPQVHQAHSELQRRAQFAPRESWQGACILASVYCYLLSLRCFVRVCP
jgi:hypothetical protein